MLVEKIEKILKGVVAPENLAATVSAIESLYYKYENNQARLSIEEQKKELAAMISPFVPKYGSEMCNEFYFHWVQHNKNGKKCRYKMEKVFDIAGRLAYWNRIDQERKQKRRLNDFLAK